MLYESGFCSRKPPLSTTFASAHQKRKSRLIQEAAILTSDLVYLTHPIRSHMIFLKK